MKQKLLYVTIALLFQFGVLFAQQVLGSFPGMDGGFEGQTATSTLSSTRSTTDWTVSATSATTRAIINNSSFARTGNLYASFNASNQYQRLQTPTGTGLLASTEYTVQFYYRTTVDQSAVITGAIYLVGTSGGANKAISSDAFISGTWLKASATFVSAGDVPSLDNFASVRASAAFTADVDVDDFVVYAGAVDVTSPDVPTGALCSSVEATTLTVSWTAPVTGVDGGGYMVVRGSSDPTTTPNANGIYPIGGLVAADEQVVYTGTNTSIDESGLSPSTKYYYRIYTVDKAFNYSSAASTNATTGSASTITSVASGDWDNAATWDFGVPTLSNNVVIADGHTVTLNASGLQCNNLTIGQGTSGELNTSSSIPSDLEVNGNIVTNAGANLKVQSSAVSPGITHTINLYGDLTHNGTSLDFRSGSTGSTLGIINLTLSGTSSSTISINTSYSSSNGDFNYLTINKTGGATVTLGSNIYINSGSSADAARNSGINFIEGVVETGNYYLAYLGSSEGQVTGYSASSYVNGSMARGMSNSGGSSKNFPVGDASGYRLFYLRSTTAGSSTGHLAIVKCITSDANNSSILSADIDGVSAVHYYEVTYDNTINGAASMSFDLFKVSYGLDDNVSDGNTDLRVAYSTDSRSNWIGIAQTSTHTTATPSQITPDAITPVNLTSGSSLYVTLANATGGSNVLPVELISFTANAINNQIQLNWKTATELNNYGFEIQASTNKENWSILGFINGHGTSNSTQNYTFVDENPSVEKHYYRLKQIDNNGEFSYSQIIEAEMITPTKFELSQNFPNPFNPSTKIKYSIPQDSRVQISVYDVTGSLIKILVNENQSAGTYSVDFNASEFSSGIYLYKISADKFSAIKKMCLIK